MRLSHLVHALRQAGPLLKIGPGGLSSLEEGITLQEDTEYFLGASSSPKHVIVTEIDEDRLCYVQAPDYRKQVCNTRSILTDLIMTGTRTWLQSGYAKYQPELAKSLKSMMQGGKGKKVKVSDFYRVEVSVEALPDADFSDVRGQDPWYAAEQYGGVGSQDKPDGTTVYSISMNRGGLKELEKDSRFKVLSVKDR